MSLHGKARASSFSTWKATCYGHGDLALPTRLAIAFEFFADEREAVNSFFPNRALEPFDILSFVQHNDDRSSDSGGPLRGDLLK